MNTFMFECALGLGGGVYDGYSCVDVCVWWLNVCACNINDMCS